MNTFKGLTTASSFYKALPRRSPQEGTRVRTYTKPQTVAMFVAGCVGRSALTLNFTEGDVPFLDQDGKILPGVLHHLIPLFSSDEASLLTMFGITGRDLLPRNKEELTRTAHRYIVEGQLDHIDWCEVTRQRLLEDSNVLTVTHHGLMWIGLWQNEPIRLDGHGIALIPRWMVSVLTEKCGMNILEEQMEPLIQ